MESITKPSWSRKFNAEEPHASVHTFARPPMMEALSLLPIAYRVGSYINKERNRGSEPIFDLSGLCLEPPKPGPNAGAPLGGLGGGSIGRGFRGDFRRWSLEPGRYVHRVIAVDSFSLRVKRGDQIYSQVLSMQNSDEGSPLASWKWNLPASCGTYHALYPRAWTVYENPVPDITVVIEQISPFLPESYSESSMPCAVFQVEVINTSATSEAEASVMFSFQNGYGGGNSCTACNTTASNGCCTCNSSSGAERATANTSGWDVCGGLAHCSFSVADDTQHPPTHGAAGDSKEEPHSWSGEVRGVCMTHPSAAPVDSVNTVTCPQCSASRNPCAPYIACATMDRVESPEANTTAETTTTAQSTASSPAPPNSPPPLDQDNSPLEDAYANCNCNCNCNFDRSGNSGLGSFAIAARVPIPSTASSNLAVGDHGSCGSGVRKEPVVSTCAQFVTEVVTPPANFPILSYFCGSRQQSDIEGAYLKSDPGDTGGRALWNSFETTGDIQDIPAPQNVADTQQIGQQKNVSKAGTRVGGAVCVRQWLAPATNAAPPSAAPASAAAGGDRVSPAENRKMYSFSLSWDNPYVRFGSSGTAKDCPAIDDPSNGKSNISGCDSDSAQPSSAPPPSDPSGSGSYLPRYYTRFFGTSGLAAPKITAFALSQVQDWRQRIAAWQARTLRNSDGATAGVRGSGGDAYAGGEGDGASGALEGRLSDTGNGDGGTDGAGSTGSMGSAGGGYYDHQLFNELYFLVDGGTVWTDSTAGVSNQLQPRPPLSQQLAVQSNFNTAATRPQADDKHSSNSREGNQWCAMGIQSCSSENDLLVPLTGRNIFTFINKYQ